MEKLKVACYPSPYKRQKPGKGQKPEHLGIDEEIHPVSSARVMPVPLFISFGRTSLSSRIRERVSLDSIEKGQKALAIIDVNQIWFFDNKFRPSANDSLYL